MLSWLGKRLVDYQLKRLSAGDLRFTLWMDAPDVQMTFPGDSSWAVDLHGKAEHERWLRRFIRAGIQISADAVIVKGFPWKMTLCVRGRDHLRSDAGELVYANRYVIWGHRRLFKVKRYEVYKDTQKTFVVVRCLVNNQLAAAAV